MSTTVNEEVEELLNYREFMSSQLQEALTSQQRRYFQGQIDYCNSRLSALEKTPAPEHHPDCETICRPLGDDSNCDCGLAKENR